MNDRHAKSLFARIRRRLDETERLLIRALERDASATSARDGYPSGRPGSGGMDAGSSTETAAIANIAGRRPRDLVHEHTEAASQALEIIDKAWVTLLDQLEAIDRLAQIRRSDPSGHCLCCGRWVEGTPNDRLRSGYCDTDRKAWEREGRPDRAGFERRRRAETAA